MCRDRAAYGTDIVWGTYRCGVWERMFGVFFIFFIRGGWERLGRRTRLEEMWLGADNVYVSADTYG